MLRKVVVTGLGVVAPTGIGREEFWANIVAGRSGIDRITLLPGVERFSTQIAGEVKDFVPERFMDRKEARRMDRFAQLAVAATRLALEDAELDLDKTDRDRVGVLIGSGIGGIRTLEQEMRVLIEKGPARISPFLVPMMIPDMAAGQVSIIFGARGPNQATVSACASGSHSIGDAFRIIQHGCADVMICGGTEASISELALAGFCAAKALSTRNDEPQRASRPFDLNRDGFVMGEGAGILILESLEHAQQRKARIYAELIGYGSTGDAYHITAPPEDGNGAARCMAMALADAGLRPEEVGYINAHGTSTKLNDACETAAIKAVFGPAAYKIPISSTKSMTGHLLGAAGSVEAVVTVLTLFSGVIPPTINYETPDPACDLDYVPNVARRQPVEVAMSNSFGFGGHNAVLVFRRWERKDQE